MPLLQGISRSWREESVIVQVAPLASDYAAITQTLLAPARMGQLQHWENNVLCYSLFRNDPRLVALRAGTPLFVEGEKPSLMYVLTSGEARIVVGGQEMERLQAGSVVGEMSLVSHEPHSATVEAVTNCEFACVDEKRFNFLIAETPGFALELMRIMAHRLRMADRFLVARQLS
jgi:CRP/FNR family cyclic AMP-dependent transcriptional regulator